MAGRKTSERRSSSVGGGVLLNFDEETPRTYIYRILKKKRLLKLFSSKRNVLVSPALWDDPFENLILNAKIKTADGEIGSFGFRNDVFGQCWTLNQASDAMWRIYSPDTTAIRIRATIGRLSASLGSLLGAWAPQQCFVGKVIYKNSAGLREFAAQFASESISPGAIARTLLIKREAFQHEREVRFIYLERSNERRSSKIFSYEVDPHWLIDQLMIDPRVPPKDFDRLKSEIVEQTGFRKTITRSTLYDPPAQLTLKLG